MKAKQFRLNPSTKPCPGVTIDATDFFGFMKGTQVNRLCLLRTLIVSGFGLCMAGYAETIAGFLHRGKNETTGNDHAQQDKSSNQHQYDL